MECLIMADIFFEISSRTGNFTVKTDFIKSTNELDFFANRVIYFWNKLPSSHKKQLPIKRP